MNPKYSKIKIVLFLILVTTTLFAKESAVLSLAESKELALKNNLNYLNSNLSLQSEQKSTASSFLNFLPTAKVTSSYTLYTPTVNTSVGDNENNTTFGLVVSQPLFQGGKIYNGYKSQQNKEKTAELSVEKSKQNLFKLVEQNYFQVQLNKKLWTNSLKSLESADKNLFVAKQRYKGGIISQLDLLKIKSNYANSEVNAITREKIYQTSLATYLNILQLKKEFVLANEEIIINKQTLSKLTSLSPQMLNLYETTFSNIKNKQNIDLKITKLNLTNFKINRETVKGNFLPSLNLTWNQLYSSSNLDDDFTRSGTLSLSASWDVFPVMNKKYDLDKSNIALLQQEHLEEQQIEQIDLNITNQLYTLIAAAKQIKSTITSLEIASQSYNKSQKAFNSGAATTLELLDSKVSLDNARNNFEQSKFNYHLAKLELQNLAGLMSVDDVEKVFEPK